LLLGAGKVVPLSQLIDAVWDGDVPTTAAKQVRNTVSDLRQLFAGTGVSIPTTDDGYELDRADSVLDLGLFTDWTNRAYRDLDRGLAAEAAAGLRAALGLWRGPASADCGSRMLQAQVVNLNEYRLTVLEDYIDLELAQGGQVSLNVDLTTEVAQHPFRERLVGQFMMALCRSGARASALAVFERTRRRLRDELGIDPDPKLQTLHRRIRSSEPALLQGPQAPSPWSGLCGDVIRLTGRTVEGTATPPVSVRER
jgi:DNA-binding SARP family transcriptional activator